MASIAAFAWDFKNHPQDLIPDALIREAAAGHVWRRRVLGPVLTVHLMVLQGLHANVSGRGLLRVFRCATGGLPASVSGPGTGGRAASGTLFKRPLRVGSGVH